MLRSYRCCSVLQPYNTSYHTNVKNKATWGIASPVEYDVPKCDATVPGCSPVPGSHNPNGADSKEWVSGLQKPSRHVCQRS